MPIQLDGTTAYLRHDYSAGRGYPKTLGGWFKVNASSSGFAITSTSPDVSGATVAAWINRSTNSVFNYRQTAAGGTNDELSGEAAQYGATGLTYLMLVATDDSTFTIYTPSYPTGRTFNPAGDNPGEIAALSSFVLGCFFNGGSRSLYLGGHIAEVAEWSSSLNAANYTALAGGAKPEQVSPGTLYEAWSLQAYQGGGTYIGLVNGRTLTAFGGVTASAVAHPVTRATPGPTISGQPANQTVTQPATANFSVTAAASGGGTLSYQWQRNPAGAGSFANVATGAGGTTNSYTTAATTVSGGNANSTDTWRCVVTETGGTNPGIVNTNAATLTVNAPAVGPTINVQPTGQAVAAPAAATFTVTATTSGGALSYQWQRSASGGGAWANVAAGTGGTTNSYTTPATTVSGGNANNGDQYRCAVTDSNGSTNSSAVSLTVNAAAGSLNFQAAGMEFGRRTGLGIGTFALDAGSNYRYSVHADGLTLGAAVYSSGVVATDSNGKLPNLSSGSLAAGTTYRVVAIRQADGEAGTFRMTAA